MSGIERRFWHISRLEMHCCDAAEQMTGKGRRKIIESGISVAHATLCASTLLTEQTPWKEKSTT
jgi:hypothetical protein